MMNNFNSELFDVAELNSEYLLWKYDVKNKVRSKNSIFPPNTSKTISTSSHQLLDCFDVTKNKVYRLDTFLFIYRRMFLNKQELRSLDT